MCGSRPRFGQSSDRTSDCRSVAHLGQNCLARLCHANGVRSREVARSNRVSCDGNRILPPGGGFGSEDAKGRPRDQMSLMVEGVVYSGMDIEKVLGGSRRLEPLHLALSSPNNLMGVSARLFFLRPCS